MEHLDVPQFLGLLVVMLGAARLGGALAKAIGQPSVLGELVAGVALGASVLGLVAPEVEVIHLLSEMGVVILLFSIGLETDPRKLLRVGGASAVVALTGVVLPFALGYGICHLRGIPNMVAIMVGAALTATSVGITARVLSDLGRLQEPEGQVVLGAAVLDDIIGLVMLTVVVGITQGEEVTLGGMATTAGIAFGFLVATLILGSFVVPPLFRLAGRVDLPGTPIILALMLAFGLAWLADRAGSALIIGAFAAGILLARAPQAREIEEGVTVLGHLFVPLFFVSVGAAVDVRLFNPFNSANHPMLVLGGLLIVAAVASKFAAGYAPFWFRGKKSVIGAGMIPRGEVGLIFAQMGLASGILDAGLYGAVTLMVMATTFVAPPLLKALLPPPGPGHVPEEAEGIENLMSMP